MYHIYTIFENERYGANMGTITKRTNPSGEVVYRAQIRITREGYPNFSESRTFSKRSLATAWIKKREAEIETNPDILFNKKNKKTLAPTLREAVERYNEESIGKFGRSKPSTLRFLASFPIGDIRLDRIKRSDISEFAMLRRRGVPECGLPPVKGATVENDLQYLRSLVKHAHFVWGMDIGWQEIDMAMEGLRRGRVIDKGEERSRLPTREELIKLTTYFWEQWDRWRAQCKYPMYLIIWFAIYSCRREAEITRLEWADFNREYKEWLVRDVKHPRGSKGNHHYFFVTDHALSIIDELSTPEMRERLRRRGLNPNCLIGGTASGISSAFTRACEILEIEDLRFHDLRHEGATRLAEDGLTPPQMQQITLHNNWRTLQRYVNMAVRKRTDRLDFAEAIEIAKRKK